MPDENSPAQEIQAGDRVRIRDDLPAKIRKAVSTIFDPAAAYRVMVIGKDFDFSTPERKERLVDLAWIGPTTLTDEDMRDFDPETYHDYARYRGVNPIALAHLRKAS